MDPKTKKLIAYESRLTLNRLRNLTEKEILTVKSKTEKSELSKEMGR